MYPLFESIKYYNGLFYLLPYHAERINRSCLTYYGKPFMQWEELKQALKKLNLDGLTKVRVNYNLDQFEIIATPYQRKIIQGLKLVYNHQIQYDLKFTDRKSLEAYQQEGMEVIIVKNQSITDAAYANLVFWNGQEWHTPHQPLLKGVKRQFLLLEREIQERPIGVQDLHRYEKVGLINAMLDLGEVNVKVADIMR